MRDRVPNCVWLRPALEADLPFFFGMQADPVARARVRYVSREYTACIRHWQRVLADPALCVRSVMVGETLVGNICAFPRDGVREVGYWLDRAVWGRGIATAALRLFIGEVERTRPLHAGVAPHNTASARVLSKCGFVRNGESDELVSSDSSPDPFDGWILQT